MIHRVWPKFWLTRKDGSLELSGVFDMHARAQSSRVFLKDTTRQQWQARLAKILRSSLTTHRQDLSLKSLLLRASSDEQRQLLDKNRRAVVYPLSYAIVPVLPQADTGAVRFLLRMFVGLEDFGRTNGHYQRRTIHPEFSNNRFERN